MEQACDLLGFSAQIQKRYEQTTSLVRRKGRGQVFTPGIVARFMAGLLTEIPKNFRLLDPGAGVGTLTAAVCERICKLQSARSCEFHLFETDTGILPLLEENLRRCRAALENAGHRVSFWVYNEDFLLALSTSRQAHSLFDVEAPLGEFDAVIANPPYFKISGTSVHSRHMARVVHGQPNIYALFMAKAAELLKPRGELVAITPRSFCSGLYFRGFRRWFFQRMSLAHIHLFESRRDTFQEADVLQESVVTLTRRLGEPISEITISTSHGRDLLLRPARRAFRSAAVVDDSCGDMIVRIPASHEENQVIELTESWPDRFQELGLRISTGPVVLFRATEFLLSELDGEGTTPLLNMQNVRPFETVWPVPKRGKPNAFLVCPDSARLLLPARNYVLLRRFSAKEERRRLVASCFLKEKALRPQVALENHLNYVYHGTRELTVNETYGLAALFNSALFDRYFRILSGNTQINARDIRTLRFPALDKIAAIGEGARAARGSRMQVEQIVLKVLGVKKSLTKHLTEVSP